MLHSISDRTPETFTRRAWLATSAAGVAAVSAGAAPTAQRGKPFRRRPIVGAREADAEFQIACMTLPYSRFPLERALTGIKAAGYRYVAWGTTHREGAERGAGARRRCAARAGQGAGPGAATWAWSR